MANADWEEVAPVPGARRPRHEARDSAPIGSADGLHLPGILPEPEVIVADDEMDAKDRAVLADLEGALDKEDRAPEEPDAPQPARFDEVAELPRQRAQLPWWYAIVGFGGAIVMLPVGVSLWRTDPVPSTLLILLGLLGVALVAMSWRNRPRKAA